MEVNWRGTDPLMISSMVINSTSGPLLGFSPGEDGHDSYVEGGQHSRFMKKCGFRTGVRDLSDDLLAPMFLRK